MGLIKIKCKLLSDSNAHAELQFLVEEIAFLGSTSGKRVLKLKHEDEELEISHETYAKLTILMEDK